MKFSKPVLDLTQKGESGSVDEDAVANETPILRTIFSAYYPSKQFNADEFALFYRLPPSTTSGPKRIPGLKKKKKERLTILACVNADGSEKMLPMAIGSSKNARCFMGRDSNELVFSYHSNKKS